MIDPNQTVTQSDLVKLTRLCRQTIVELQRRNIIPRGNEIKLGEAIHAIIKHYAHSKAAQHELLEEKARKEKALADMAELERDKRRGRLVMLSDVLDVWESVVLQIRARMLAMPMKVAPLIAFCRGQREIQSALEKEVREILDEVSQPQNYKQARPEPIESDDTEESAERSDADGEAAQAT